MRSASNAQGCTCTIRQVLLLYCVGALCGVALSCGYRWVGADPVAIACMFPVENLSKEVGAGQAFDLALRSRLGKAGGGAPAQAGADCLRAQLMQVSQNHLASYEGRVTQLRLSAVLVLSLDREGLKPIQVIESEEFGHGADILLTEASMRAALARLAERTAQKGFEYMQMQWHSSQ